MYSDSVLFRCATENYFKNMLKPKSNKKLAVSKAYSIPPAAG